MRRWVIGLAAALPLAATGAEPVELWGEADQPGIPPAFQAWHAQHEDNGDYGESWFFMTHGHDGGALFALVSVTNLGLRTFDASVDVQYYPVGGGVHSFHEEYRRDALSGSTTAMDMRVGGAHAWGGGRSWHLEVEEPGISLDLDLSNRLPPYRFGDGVVTFHADRSAEWALGMHAPSASASGTLTMDGHTWDLAGHGYHDHGWSTIKLPSAIQRWHAVRALSDHLDLVLHDQQLTDRFGGGHNRFGLVGLDGRIVASSRNFRLTPVASRTVEGVDMPTAFDLSLRSGGYTLSGRIEEVRFQDAVDVLGQVSLPVRLAIKAFYANPRLLRYVGRYDLELVHPDGTTEALSGQCLVEADTY